MRHIAKLAAAFGGLLLASPAGAAVIYLQNFSAASGSGMNALSGVNWNAYYGNASTNATLASTGSSGVPANAMISAGTSAASPGANVNASQTTSNTANGFVPLLSSDGAQQFFVYTNEYTINRSVYSPTSFSWYSASAYVGDSQQLVVQIDGNWYASTSSISPAAPLASAMNFGTFATKQSTPFSSAASSWETVNFTPGSPLTLGSVLTSPLPGDNITGFGIYAQIANQNSGTERTYFDTFEVDATPEPAGGAIGLAIGAFALCGRRRTAR